jgi:hypothetical protein
VVPAAYAGTTPQATGPVVQTVVAGSGTAAATACAANIPGPTADYNHERIDKWWYLKSGNDICVGTVFTTTYAAAAKHKVNPQLRVYSGSTLVAKGCLGGCSSKTWVHKKTKVQWTIRLEWPAPITLRATAEIKGGGTLGPAVVTVK